jgi:hypothetical protein
MSLTLHDSGYITLGETKAKSVHLTLWACGPAVPVTLPVSTDP